MSRQVLTMPDVPTTLLTEAEASTTYLTQTNAATTYLPLSHAPGTDPHTQYYNQSRGDGRYLQISTAASTYQPIGSYSLTSHNHDASYSLTSHNHSALYLPLTGGTLTGNLGVGVTPYAWPAGFANLQVWRGGIIGHSSGGSTSFVHNTSYDGTNSRALVTGQASQLQLTNTGPMFSTAPSVAAGAIQTFTERLRLDVNGTLGLGVIPEVWRSDTRTIRVGSTLSFQGYAPGGGSDGYIMNNSYLDDTGLHAIENLSAFRVALLSSASEFRVQTAPAVAAGAVQTHTTRLTMSLLGGLTLTPATGTAGLTVSGGTHYFVIGPGAAVNTNSRISTTNNMEVDATGNYFMPSRNGIMDNGNASYKWYSVHAVTGTIQTSSAQYKEAFSPLDPAICAQAVLGTDWLDYRYLPPPYEEPPEQDGEAPEQRQRTVDEGKAAYAKRLVETAPARRRKGYVLGSPAHRTHDLFGLEDRESASPSSDLAVVACALQGALKRIATLETHILQLEAAR